MAGFFKVPFWVFIADNSSEMTGNEGEKDSSEVPGSLKPSEP